MAVQDFMRRFGCKAYGPCDPTGKGVTIVSSDHTLWIDKADRLHVYNPPGWLADEWDRIIPLENSLVFNDDLQLLADVEFANFGSLISSDGDFSKFATSFWEMLEQAPNLTDEKFVRLFKLSGYASPSGREFMLVRAWLFYLLVTKYKAKVGRLPRLGMLRGSETLAEFYGWKGENLEGRLSAYCKRVSEMALDSSSNSFMIYTNRPEILESVTICLTDDQSKALWANVSKLVRTSLGVSYTNPVGSIVPLRIAASFEPDRVLITSQESLVPAPQGKRCPNCNALLREEDSFCIECGHEVKRTCSDCGAEFVNGQKYCGKCGKVLRKQTT